MLHLEINVKRRHIYALVAAIALIVTIVPLASYAASEFTDVPDSNIFQDDINWLADAGVTLGCNPPANDQFCPEDNVRRETMAAFMRRLAENQVVDAKTAIDAENAVNADFADEADVAALADDSELLDGQTAEELTANKPIGVGYYNSPTLAGTGVTAISSPGTGVFCLTIDPSLGLEADDVIVQVAVEWGASSGDDLYAFWQGASPTFSCTVGEIEVRTYKNSGSSNSVAWTYAMYERPPSGITITGAPEGGNTNAGN